jgi:mycothiol synthase
MSPNSTMSVDCTPVMPTPPPVPGSTWRPLVRADAPTIHALLTQIGLWNGIAGVDAVADYDAIFDDPAADPAHNSLGLFDEAGALQALDWLTHDPDTVDSVRLDVWIDVHPDHSASNRADFLLSWQEARAHQIADALPPDRRVWLNAPTDWSQADRVRRYEAAGYTARHSEQFMQRNLRQPIPAHALPNGIRLEPWTPDRDDLMRRAFNAAFGDKPGARTVAPENWRRYYTGISAFCPDLSVIILHGQDPIGLVRCLIAPDDPTTGEIGHVAVRQDWRRRGIGRAVLLATLRGLADRGVTLCKLSVATHNAPAIAAYEQIGFVTSGGYTSYSKTVRKGTPTP